MLGFLEIFRRQILLARVSGIPVRIDLRWLFVVALMSWITAAYLSPRYVENFAAALSIGAATTIVLFLSRIADSLMPGGYKLAVTGLA